MAVESDGRPVEVGGARVRALLALLALEAGRSVATDRLIDALWPDDPPANAANALQTLVKRLRTALRGIKGGAPLPASAHASPVVARSGGYALEIPAAAVDAHVFARALDDGDLDAALALWRGPALADLRAVPHLANVAASLEERRLAAVEARAAALLTAGVPNSVPPVHGAPEPAALAAALTAELAAHPLRERLAALAVRALAAAGRQADALALYERTRATLDAELGVDPGPDLREAHLQVLRGDLPPTRHTPQVRQAVPGTDLPLVRHAPRHDLRRPLTGFVGRDDELAQLTALLETARMVTIVGPGGAGKTRLATEAALRASATATAEGQADQARKAHAGGLAAGGAWMVELAPVTDAADIPGVLLDTLGLRDDPGGFATTAADPMTRLTEALNETPGALLVLDNCEHLIEAAAVVAAKLLDACPATTILATSREPLAVPGEHLVPIPPLGLPPRAPTPPPPPATRPCACWSIGPWRPGRRSGSTRATSPPSPPSAAASTACRWRSSWPPPGCAR
ncbi:AAA family ATPase [Nonomuraea sp. NBC_01738]|uniref:AfsR/SARP family transcriptional regulator n=1 Tax=Nonomuraea sp. NBC_01738 TaxID=2976003 RepID=UPI002E159D53|nr:AAA family ATPase [Nonomuraea sp. NBC_01738]